MDDQDSEKKSEIWLKYCEDCINSKIRSEDRSQCDAFCTHNKEDPLKS